MLVKEGTWTVSYVLEVHVGGMGSVGRMAGSSKDKTSSTPLLLAGEGISTILLARSAQR